MSTAAELRNKATGLGQRHGRGSAEWYFDRSEPSRDDYLRVLKGIEDGDPAILDTFVSGSLSGEWADDMTPRSLFDELDMTDSQIITLGDEVCEAFEQGFNSAYQDKVVETCQYHLKRNITFSVEVELIEQDERKLLSDIEELLAKANASLVESQLSEEGEVIDV